MRSVTRKVRNSEASRSIWPGPRSTSHPEAPNRTAVTLAYAAGVNQDWPGPTPPMVCTFGNIWSAVCELPETFSEVLDPVTQKGSPLKELSNPLSCQPETIAPAIPPRFNMLLPRPNGNSAIPENVKTCVRSYGITERFSCS